MKKSIILIAILLLLVRYNVPVFAQFQISGPVSNRWGQTIPTGGNTTHAIGIGDFDNSTTPRARLHINDNLLPYNGSVFGTSFQRGEMFRTDGRDNIENNWKLFTGGTGSANPFGTERFKLFVRANESIVRFQATQPNTNQLQLPIQTLLPTVQ